MDTSRLENGRILWIGPRHVACALEAATSIDISAFAHIQSTREILRRLRREHDLDAIVIACESAPDESLELCRRVKLEEAAQFVPVIFILSPEVAGRREDAYEAGADDCIQLPAAGGEIARRVKQAVHFKKATDSLEDSAIILTVLANAIEGRDAYTCGHVERVAEYSVQIARALGLGDKQVEHIRTGALVHDVGKVAVPDQILNKPGRLADNEMAIMKRHPVIGYDILKPLRTFQCVLPIVRWHHEQPGGGGYPDGLSGEAIPLPARIVAVADCFDAISTDRPYRRGLEPQKCQEILSCGAEDGLLDRASVEAFLLVLNGDIGRSVQAPEPGTDQARVDAILSELART